MTKHLLIGDGHALTQARYTASEMGLSFSEISLTSVDHYNYDLTPILQHYSATDTRIFVALDERAVNFARHKLIADIRLAGYPLINLISPTAAVEDNVRLLGNVYIGSRCSIAGDSSIGVGCWLDRQVTLEHGVRLGACVTLRAGVIVERSVEIGRGSTLSSGSQAAEGAQIGRHCEWLLGGKIPSRLPDYSFFDDLMPEGARIFKH
ncbi:acetyltransferase [Pseudomonas sp. CDFA 602]|uniref:acetyltransferase n=1 Tax=Pseudomonas californiensis TaxID=2829823 RepID=UPI001E5850C8|nr:acetyltransferase [Pseudomonas californiensis]MCD5996851.1 acetyltransferase [Pseudomonas californiensis]MCD5998326.1 acetyltransferase [Pseudomonas californiensis]